MASTRRRLARIIGLLLIATLAWVAWRVSLPPSQQARVAPRTQSPPTSRLEEELQMARAYVRDVLPRSGPYRYASADDYLWIETKDCAPALSGMLEMAQANDDSGRSPEHAMRYAALGANTAQILQISQLAAKQGIGVDGGIAMQCGLALPAGGGNRATHGHT